MSETMVFRFHSGQSLRASIEHEAALYYSLRDTAGNPLVVSRDRVREIVPLADVEPCPDAFSGAATDPGHSWDGDACALCGKSREAAPANVATGRPVMSARDELLALDGSDEWPAKVDAILRKRDAETLGKAAKELTNLPLWYTADLHADWETGVQEAAMRVQEMADKAASPAAVPVPDETAGDKTGEAPCCTCARSWGLHSKDCALYTPGHELIAKASPCHVNVTGHRMVNGHCLYCAKSQAEVQS